MEEQSKAVGSSSSGHDEASGAARSTVEAAGVIQSSASLADSAPTLAEARSKDRRIENLILAAWRWGDVQPACVISGLGDWKCGTQACFGGHVVSWPEFRAQGVRADKFGSPVTKTIDDPHAVGNALFGSYDIFDISGCCDDDKALRALRVSLWEIVRNRIEAQFARLTAA